MNMNENMNECIKHTNGHVEMAILPQKVPTNIEVAIMNCYNLLNLVDEMQNVQKVISQMSDTINNIFVLQMDDIPNCLKDNIEKVKAFSQVISEYSKDNEQSLNVTEDVLNDLMDKIENSKNMLVS